jgi:hypothetical protein
VWVRISASGHRASRDMGSDFRLIVLCEWMVEFVDWREIVGESSKSLMLLGFG